MKHKLVPIFLIFLLLLNFASHAARKTSSESSDLILEVEQHWETYGVGGTCISGTHNLFVADVDGDGIMEIMTGGSMYNLVNKIRTTQEAPLKIWNWNGQNITSEKNHKWEGRISCVYAGDADGDGEIEIITAGGVRNSTGSYAQLRIWNWDGETLVLEACYEGTIAVGVVFVSDVNKDGAPEILTVGRFFDATKSGAQLCIWHYDGNSLTLKEKVDWCTNNVTSANSLHAYDLNNDGEIEIITGGYANDLKNSTGQLCIWHLNGEEISLKASEEWRLVEGVYALNIAGNPMGNTIVNNVKVGDVDDDGTAEIIAGGFSYDGEKVNAQLRLWNWNGQALNLEKSQEWTTEDIAEVKSVSINDVDSDGKKEIITSGFAGAQGGFGDNNTSAELAQLRVWTWDGTNLTLRHNKNWVVGDGVCAWNVATGDVDKDNVVEIVTVGCMYTGSMCDPDMRIWSITSDLSTPPPIWSIELVIAAAASVTLVALAGAYLHAKKPRKLKQEEQTRFVCLLSYL